MRFGCRGSIVCHGCSVEGPVLGPRGEAGCWAAAGGRVLKEEEDRAVDPCLPMKAGAASRLPRRGQGRRLSPRCYFWHLLLRSSFRGAAGAGSRRRGAQRKTGSAPRGTLRPFPACPGLEGTPRRGVPRWRWVSIRPAGVGRPSRWRWASVPLALGVSPEHSTACSCLGHGRSLPASGPAVQRADEARRSSRQRSSVVRLRKRGGPRRLTRSSPDPAVLAGAGTRGGPTPTHSVHRL